MLYVWGARMRGGMVESEAPSRELIEVWAAIARHFLDTETRHTIPRTALCAARAGLDVAALREAWLGEINAVLWSNLYEVAGEWALWPRAWLVASIREERARSRAARALSRAARPDPSAGTRQSVERCLALLLGAPDEERAELSEGLEFFARHCFDFVPSDKVGLSAGRRAAIAELAPEPLWSILEPSFVPGYEDLGAMRERVESARSALLRGS